MAVTFTDRVLVCPVFHVMVSVPELVDSKSRQLRGLAGLVLVDVPDVTPGCDTDTQGPNWYESVDDVGCGVAVSGGL
ncbi:hypothetical protein ACFWFB_33510 [Streptomyces albidoflavus]